jgi:acetyl-CoA carboxylase biotin carboxyl carrier protein
LDLKRLEGILQVLEERDIAEFEFEDQEIRFRVRRREGATHPAGAVGAVPRAGENSAQAAAIVVPVVPAVAVPAPPLVPAEPEAGVTVLNSPIVGTFYRAPDPNSSPFVNVGDHVRVGQVLCIIEAMKLMNEIEAEVAGTIVTIHQENGQPVQYGAPLFSIRAGR